MAVQQKIEHRKETYYVRFPLIQRIEHILLVASFTTLAFTGLAQKFTGNALADGFVALLGGIETVRIIHHVAAILLALETVYHVIILGYKIFVLRVEMTMLPGLRDLIDALDIVRHNLGLTAERPKLPRYSFEEKAEYWAMIWGTIVMGLTGFMLWNPIVTSRILPGQIIPAAKAAHGGEAVLAVLAIIVWHFYNVHVKTFNRSIFTGKLTQHQMEDEHGEELQRLLNGKLRPEPAVEARRRRERLFLPVALVTALVGIAAIYLLTSYETTAIATVPPVSTPVQVFAPLTPTPVVTPVGGVDNRNLGTLMKHAVTGMEKCDTCHGPKGVSPMPANHEGRPVESCLICHKPGPTPTPGAATTQPAGAGGPKAIPANHDLASPAYKDCTLCHGAGKIKPSPANHASFTTDSCTTCHKTAAAGASSQSGGAGAAEAIPANHDLASPAYKDCTLCHGAGKIKPSPANHASYTAETCTTCHKPAAAGGSSQSSSAAAAKAIPANHDLSSPAYKDCTLCHGAGKIKPTPTNHASYTAETCTTCHKPASK